MLRSPFLSGVLLLAWTCSAAPAQNDKAKADKDTPGPKIEAKPEPKLIPFTQVAGTLQQTSDTGMLKLRVPTHRHHRHHSGRTEDVSGRYRFSISDCVLTTVFSPGNV